jgi:type I restriction enzyme S subunit
MSEYLFKDILLETKDGEWGKGEPGEDLVRMKVIRGTDFEAVRNFRLDDAPERFIPRHIAERKSLKPYDILLETAGGTKDQPTGRSVILKPELFKKTDLPITCASFSRFLRVNSGIANPEYIFWWLQYMYESRRIEVFHVQHTGVARFQYTLFAATTNINLPPDEEQSEVVRTLSCLDKKIELNQRMNDTLEGIARTLFKSWFVNFDPVKAKAEGRRPEGMDEATAALFPSNLIESSLGLIPDGWEISEIGKEVEVIGGSTPSTQESAYWEDGRFYWATPKDLSKLKSPILLDTERKITELGVKQISSGQLPIDTVLLSSRAPVGYIALAKVPVSINQGFIAMKCVKKLSPYYVINWTYSALEEIKARATGTTFAEISKSVFRPIKIIG